MKKRIGGMRMKKRMVIVAMALSVFFLMSGIAMAFSHGNHVIVAPNNKGDAMIFPLYLAIDGGWETKLKIVNTSTTHSVVAKLIVRSAVYSQEVLDFLIYLSPADVWTGKLMWDATKGAKMYSEDHSALSGPGVWASATNPMDQELVDVTCAPDFNEMGYVTVIECWSISNSDDDWGSLPEEVKKTATAPDCGINKAAIKWMYDRDYGSFTTYNVLAGWQSFGNPTYGVNSRLRPVTFADNNINAKLEVGDETWIGQITGGAENNLMEIEAVLSKDNVAMPYVNDGNDMSLHFFTFPTKLTQLDADCCVMGGRGPFWDPATNSTLSWRELIDTDCYRYLCLKYNLKAYDTEECTPTDTGSPFSPAPPSVYNWFCWELNWVATDTLIYDEGWINYSVGATTIGSTVAGDDLEYTGWPVIPVTVNLGASGLTAAYGAWDNGVVDGYTSPELPYYQYSDYYTPAP